MTRTLWTLLVLLPAVGLAQVPVDENGREYGAAIEELGGEDIPRLSSFELQELVGPIALYPDDLLAVVLPASTYPLQVIEAGRFLEELETNPDLEPNEEWDDSVVALINYPEVVELLNDDLDWTWRLGEAVVSQQADVIAAVEKFRDRAYAAGNLKSDDYQTVSRSDGVVSIEPAADDVIYVPYYEPTRVVVHQPRPVYYYYPRPRPVYYYPYPDTYAFHSGFFWGVTTAFTIGWTHDHLTVYHPSYHRHPFYGHSYWDRWWYRRPTINVYRNTYINNVWRPTPRSGIVRRVTRNDYRPPGAPPRTDYERRVRSTHVVPARAEKRTKQARREFREEREAIKFRARPEQRTVTRQPARNETRAGVRSERRVTPDRERQEWRASTKRQTRAATVPRQTRAAPAQRQTRAAPAPRQTRAAPAPRQSRAAPPPRQTRSAPAAQQARKSVKSEGGSAKRTRGQPSGSRYKR
ncbi:MAG: DUF3300 domain-containing protein [Woeseiaceae bacterium]|nr:DUF3300 domain-containing protein [Woeseiaceae bacterium]